VICATPKNITQEFRFSTDKKHHSSDLRNHSSETYYEGVGAITSDEVRASLKLWGGPTLNPNPAALVRCL